MSDGWQPRTRPWIVCAANRNKKTGVIICGARHFDKLMQGQVYAMAPWWAHLNKRLMVKYWHKFGWSASDQGFVDQFGRFYHRDEALMLAKQNEQCFRNPNADVHLFSEDLY